MLGKGWRLRYSLILAAMIVIMFAANIPQSFAHPVYVDSSPKPFQSIPSSPGEVSVFFSEPIELAYSTIRVLGPDGNTVDLNDPHNVEGDTASIAVSLQPNLPEGQYTVTTNVLSAVDGHVVGETFVFGVGTNVQQSSLGANQQQQAAAERYSLTRRVSFKVPRHGRASDSCRRGVCYTVALETACTGALALKRDFKDAGFY